MTSIGDFASTFGRRGPAFQGMAALAEGEATPPATPPAPDGAGPRPTQPIDCTYTAYLEDHDTDAEGKPTGMSYGQTALLAGTVVTALAAGVAAVLSPGRMLMAGAIGAAAGAAASTGGAVYQYTQWKAAGGPMHGAAGACERYGKDSYGNQPAPGGICIDNCG